MATVEIGRAEAKSGGDGYSWYALFVLLLICISNFIDRQILSILAEDIKADLGPTDQQLGVLYGTVFAIFFSLFGIPLGRLADGWYRGRLIALGLVVWSAMTALSGIAGSFGQLAIARMGVGVGEASAVPAAYSMLGDYFRREKKGFVLSIYMAGSHIGIGLSLVIGGFIVSRWAGWYPDGSPFGLAGWQATFIIVGLPGLLLAVWVLTLREPTRGISEGMPSPTVQPGIWKEFGRELMAIVPPLTLWSVSRYPGALKINLLAAAAIAAVSLGLIAATGDVLQWAAFGIGLYSVISWVQTIRFRDAPTYALTWGQPLVITAVVAFGMIGFLTNTAGFWMSPYAMREFGATPAMTGMSIGIPGAIASVAGVLTGGRLSDAWKARDERGRIFVCMVSMIGSAVFVGAAFNVASFDLYLLLVPMAFFMGNMWIGPAVATLQDLVLPRMRGVAAATSAIGSTMVGYALGPYISGKIATETGSLRLGVLALYVVVPLGLALLWLVARRIGWLERTRIDRAAAAGETM